MLKAMLGTSLAAATVVASPWAPTASADGVQFSGAGTNDSSFISNGCTASTDEGDCIVKFPARYLRPLQSEMLPSYRCPLEKPMLVNRPSNRGDRMPPGVDVIASYGVDTVNPSGTLPLVTGAYFAGATSQGGLWTATNWITRDGKYSIALFCTDAYDRSYPSKS